MDQKENGVMMPIALTAENGSKGLMTGEFFEEVEVNNEAYCGCEKCDFCIEFPETPETITIKVPVTWTTIKEIYKKLVEYHTTEKTK